MNERERLTELISEAKDIYPTIPLVNGCKPEFKYFLAYYLLANGVLCPPCKVGDTVYYLTTVDTEEELNVNEIFYGTVQGVSFDGKTFGYLRGIRTACFTVANPTSSAKPYSSPVKKQKRHLQKGARNDR